MFLMLCFVNVWNLPIIVSLLLQGTCGMVTYFVVLFFARKIIYCHFLIG